MSCISSMSFVVLTNGSPTSIFGCSKGIRQSYQLDYVLYKFDVFCCIDEWFSYFNLSLGVARALGKGVAYCLYCLFWSSKA